jgi:hypothetical protein
VSGLFDGLDPAERELARRLARADFAADSRARAGLRARLLARGPRRPAARPALAAAALAVLLVAPLRVVLRRLSAPAPRYARGENGLPVLPGRFDADGADAGRVEETPDGRRIVWDVDGERLALETRRVTIDELFVRRPMR